LRVPWQVPVMQAPIGPAATPELVRAVSGVGALGTLAASWTEPEVLRRQLHALRAGGRVDYCVNLVLAFDQLERLEVVLAEGTPFVSFSWGIDGALIGAAREHGAFVLVQVGDAESAVEAAERGAHAVIAQGIEAGGHVQGRTPILELLREIRSVLQLPIVAAGGIADVSSARAALDAGADAVACGTAFLVADEADVHPIYRDRLLRSAATDTVLTRMFDVGWPDAPHRVIRNDTYERWEAEGCLPSGTRTGEGEIVATRDGSPIERYSDAQPTSRTVGDVDAMALYAGISVGHLRRRASAGQITNAIARALT
jgi:NAD(P)H-dependent flavin oxidoreductase YrpB (nitropropane dioxygenase family)